VQRFPKLERYPGGPPERPYDVAGWTLPFQLGVRADSIGERIDVATTPVTAIRPEPEGCAAGGGRAYQVLDARNTASYATVFTALKSGQRVRVADAPVRTTGGATLPAGSFVLERAANGACAAGYASALPSGRTLAAAPRVALYKSWTANMDEGWTRWVFEQHAVPYASVSDSAIKAGNLRARYDVLVVPDMSLRDAQQGMRADQVPAPYAGGLGTEGMAALRAFVEAGGTLVLLDHAAEIATGPLGLPLTRIAPSSRLAEAGGGNTDADSARSGGPARDPLYAPGSILRVLVDGRHPIAAGMADTAAVYFTNSTSFDLSRAPQARVIARYPERANDILMSGYLQGGEAIAGKAAAAEVPMGSGRVVLFGFRPQYRGQSVGTFKLLFNALLTGGSTASASR
jgi:hypothetical protein